MYFPVFSLTALPASAKSAQVHIRYVHAGLRQNVLIVHHGGGANVIVYAVVVAIILVVVEAAHDQHFFVRLNDAVEGNQGDVLFFAGDEVGVHRNLDVHQIRRAGAGLQGDQQVVVQIIIAQGFGFQLDGTVRWLVPADRGILHELT